MPTVLDFLGVERPDNLDGRSLPPAMRDPSSVSGRKLHRPLIRFMLETGAAQNLIESRRELRI